MPDLLERVTTCDMEHSAACRNVANALDADGAMSAGDMARNLDENLPRVPSDDMARAIFRRLARQHAEYWQTLAESPTEIVLAAVERLARATRDHQRATEDFLAAAAEGVVV